MKNIQLIDLIRKKYLVLFVLMAAFGFPGTNLFAQDIDNPDAFITTWNLQPNNTVISIKLDRRYEHDFVIDWGDGSEPETVALEIDPSEFNSPLHLVHTPLSHLYSEPGKYQVSLTGTFPGVSLESLKIVTVNQWGTQKWRTMSFMFTGIVSLDFDLIDPNEVPDLSEIDPEGGGMAGMFRSSNFNGDLSQWDVSRVTNMRQMFEKSNFNGDISQWNVSSVTEMWRMFESSNFNGDISQWDVSNVVYMDRMFLSSDFNGDISQWDLPNLESIYQMFASSDFNGDISNWDVSNISDMALVFQSTDYNGDISQWDVSNVVDMTGMFIHSSFNGDIGQWDVSNVSNMEYMFENSSFNGDISQWDVSNVTNMENMFRYSAFSGDISRWDVSNVTNAYDMFDGARNFNGNLSRWDLRKAFNRYEVGAFIRNTAMSRANYTSLLYGWSRLTWFDSTTRVGTIDVGDVQFKTSYDEFENDDTLDAKEVLERAGWVFRDGGGYSKAAERDNE